VKPFWVSGYGKKDPGVGKGREKEVLINKTIILGVTGSVAAYKAVELAGKLTQAGARVEVVMTKSAQKFVTPLTFHSITGRKALTDTFKDASERGVWHVALGEAADLVVIAPASAATIARLATGVCDDMLSLVVMATKAPVILAPAMNVNMFENAANQENLATLKARGFTIVDPEYGRLASGARGKGRLAGLEKIIAAIEGVLGARDDLAGKKLVVTAGGTREPIDPVRYIGNPSSGKMGYAIAEAARDRGAVVTLITAASLPEPEGMTVVPVDTAARMKRAVDKAVAKADALLMAAAVADYQPKAAAKSKIKKDNASLSLELVRTPDILGEVKGNFIRVGFAAESDDLIANARKKLGKKQLDLIVANDITAKDSGFGVDTNKVTLIDKKGKAESLPLMSKREVADKILDRVVGLLGKG
jgi:phosphopantothenoylcysteine decarboxylase/phosphopantothenate--cysteine ligase